MLLEGDLYALVINLITLSHEKQVQSLEEMMWEKALFLSDIKIDRKFQLNVHDREQQKCPDKVIDIDELEFSSNQD